ncbi:MAG: hypothetical protein GXP49_10405 [Deltaproteobacteria bacterium]|nr:hypothetical protein [Deltaproteobacteria bacterium]
MERQVGTIKPGARVRHPELGLGEVARSRRGGRSLQVRFDSNPRLLLEVRLQELELLDARSLDPMTGTKKPAIGSIKHSQGKKLPLKTEKADTKKDRTAAMVLEALRTGVVPSMETRQSSVGRDKELELVTLDLDEAEDRGSARVFLGDYGAGKTHMLELVEQEALQKGFLVGKATMDPLYARPNQPMRIYRQLVSRLKYPDRLAGDEQGLEPLLVAATTDDNFMDDFKNNRNVIARHLYLRSAVQYYHILASKDDRFAMDLLLDWISGHRERGNQDLDTYLKGLGGSGPRVYSLKDFQPWAHVYSYLVSGISILARSLGYKGLVLLLDEAENYDLLGSAAKAFADTTFKCMSLAALGEKGVSFDAESIPKGGFPPQKKLPFLFNWPHGIYLVCAMTPSTHGERLLRDLVGDERITELTPLTLKDYRKLSERISGLFERAYPAMNLPAKLKKPLGEVMWSLIKTGSISSPRDAAKLSVEFLDMMRLSPALLADFFKDLDEAMS